MNLPDKASELLRLAIHDLELCEKDPNYIINMETWHHSIHNTLSPVTKICRVCLAGSVMAKTGEIPIDQSIIDIDETFNAEYADKFDMLNKLRMGDFCDITEHFGFDYYGTTPPESYSENPEVFKQQMLDLADILEVEGL